MDHMLILFDRTALVPDQTLQGGNRRCVSRACSPSFLDSLASPQKSTMYLSSHFSDPSSFPPGPTLSPSNLPLVILTISLNPPPFDSGHGPALGMTSSVSNPSRVRILVELGLDVSTVGSEPKGRENETRQRDGSVRRLLFLPLSA